MEQLASDYGVDEMNDQSKPLLAKVLFVIEQFERDEVGIPEAQGVVDSVSGLLERNDQALIDELRDCEADLEFIRFATPNEQQRSAALTRLRRTDLAIRAAIGA
ncbi:MAG: hypothetical protein ABI067_07430 [Leifsonia sp.]